MRAKPLLTYGLVASALALPASAWALGLGRLTVDSALGQPLSARIELTSATRDELETLNAKVADPSLYRQNNLTYQGVLARTRVVVETSGGTPFLRVTSPIAVNEPFLDLMVELNWSSGRVVREYTFLLDPPGAAAPAVAEPVTPPRTGTAARPAPASSSSAAAAAAAAPSSGAIRTPSAASPGTGSQYTVKRGDTLAGIASQYKPENATLEQMLAALFKGNPNAFDDNNMNRLRRGAIMNVPAPAEVAGSDPAEAARVVRMQASDWRNYRNRVAGTVPATDGAGTRSTAGRIGASVTETTPSATPGGDRVVVQTTPRTRANEDLAAAQKDAKENRDKVAQLEKMVRDLQERLNKLSPGGAAPSDAAGAKGPQLAVAPPVALPPPAATPPSTSAPAPTATAPAAPPAAEPPKAAEPAKATPAAPAATPAPAAPKVEPAKAAPKAAPSFFEDIFANTPLWAIGAGAVAVLAGLAALIAARRRKATKFEDSIISGTDIKTNTVFGSTGGGVVNTGENSLASDFSREGLGNIDTDEVDPIAEAEVYLAYGRDAQAEEILKDALKKDPQRQEIYLKLLEIHAQHNKPSAFETVATELFAVSQGQGEVWPKAVALGRQLDPNNPMFAEGGAPPIPGMAAARAAESAAGGAALRKSEPPLDRMIDDDITIAPGMKPHAQDSVFGGAPKAPEMSVKDKIEASAASFKSTMADVAGAGTVAVAGAMAAGKSEIDTLAGNLGDKVDTATQPAKYDLDFHLDEADKVAPLKPVGDAAPDTGPTPSQLMRPAAALELDKLDLSFDPDKATFEDPTPSVLDGQWHDAATKLDLAKAYQEMGDVEGAREILQEVLHEGDDQQKTEAQTLLGKLG